MKKFLITSFIFVLAAIITLFAYQIFKQSGGFQYISAKGVILKVEIANTQEKQMKGLSGRKALDKNEAMLFIFEKNGIYPFWMKGMLFPLDIIWLNQNKEIIFISESNQPCRDSFCQSINPGIEALYVLEVNADIARKLNLEKGDMLDF